MCIVFQNYLPIKKYLNTLLHSDIFIFLIHETKLKATVFNIRIPNLNLIGNQEVAQWL